MTCGATMPECPIQSRHTPAGPAANWVPIPHIIAPLDPLLAYALSGRPNRARVHAAQSQRSLDDNVRRPVSTDDSGKMTILSEIYFG